jgi:hypothetical protein
LHRYASDEKIRQAKEGAKSVLPTRVKYFLPEQPKTPFYSQKS